MDALDGAPKCILGYNVKTRTQIVLTCLIPSAVSLLVYVSLITIDVVLIAKHFLDKNYLFAGLTALFVLMPAVICFVVIMLSACQWPQQKGCTNDNIKFFFRQLFNLVFFPLGAIFRFARRMFWSIDSLFHERESLERHHSACKAAENSPFELYHFLQSFFQSAPQIILQLFIVLREGVYRNYDTTFVQILSIIFSLIKMAMTVESFHRFESQKIVGRSYPWSSAQETQARKRHLNRTTSVPENKDTEKFPPFNDEDLLKTFSNLEIPRKTLNLGQNNFNSETNEKLLKEPNFVSNITDDDKINNRTITAHIESPQKFYNEVDNNQKNLPDDDLLEHIHEIEEYFKDTEDTFSTPSDDVQFRDKSDGHIESFDASPSLPPPPRPTSVFPYMETIQRFSKYKNMLIFNAENFIKEHVPRLPEGAFEHHHPNEGKAKTTLKTAEEPQRHTDNAPDEVDFLLPTRKKMVDGIEQDDIVAKGVSFTAWVMFLLMRMISLSTFSVFYPKAVLYLCLAHYLVMLTCLYIETRFHCKKSRSFFYIVLAYIYIFALLEFKIKFKYVRRWYGGYFGFVFLQNIIITVAWYAYCSFESWWLTFMLSVIIQSGILAALCMLFYFYLLKPKDKVLFINE